MTKMSHLYLFLMSSMILLLYYFISNSTHPMILIFMIMMYTMMMFIQMSSWKYNFIYSIMLFLIMISGMMIIFLYFASLISNEQNKPTLNIFMTMTLILNFMFLIYSMKKNKYLEYLHYYNSESSNQSKIHTHLFENIQKIYEYPFNNLSMLSIIFLMLAMFSIIKTCNLKSFALRKIN